MQAWWESLPLLGQIFAVIAIPATAVMIIQSLLLLFGVGFGHDLDIHGHDMDASGHDTDHDGLSLITIRGLVAFFSIGGWTGLVLVSANMPTYAAILIAFIAGTLALAGIAYIFKSAMKLQDRGNLEIKNALYKTGTVYIPIPQNSSGQGKITIMVQERLIELQAMTQSDRILKTGEIVKVVDLVDDETVLVESINQAPEKNNNIGGISKWVQKQ